MTSQVHTAESPDYIMCYVPCQFCRVMMQTCTQMRPPSEPLTTPCAMGAAAAGCAYELGASENPVPYMNRGFSYLQGTGKNRVAHLQALQEGHKNFSLLRQATARMQFAPTDDRTANHVQR